MKHKITPLTDMDPMPYGAHKGTLMIDVPDEYLLHMYRHNKCTPEVKAYIEDVLQTLKETPRPNAGKAHDGAKRSDGY